MDLVQWWCMFKSHPHSTRSGVKILVMHMRAHGRLIKDLAENIVCVMANASNLNMNLELCTSMIPNIYYIKHKHLSSHKLDPLSYLVHVCTL